MSGPALLIGTILCLVVSASGAAGAPSAPGVLVPGADMSVARAAHTATTLRDGRILVAGGFGRNGSVEGAELYDPRTGRFSPGPAMVTKRQSHSATLLSDGRVLIAGGYGKGTTTLATAEIFDPATSAFTSVGSLHAARANHVAVLLRNGKVLVTGGAGPGWTTHSSAELYDPATGRFTRTGGMSVAREGHSAVRLRDGRVLVAGGHRGRRAELVVHASAEVYDPVAGSFRRVGEMRVRRHKHDAILLPDGRALIVAGSDERDDRGMYASTEYFDPATGAFTAGPRLNSARFKLLGTTLVLPHGTVLVAGGSERAELYDPNRRAFSVVPAEASMAGRFSAVAALADSGALITGGYGSDIGPRASTWIYRP